MSMITSVLSVTNTSTEPPFPAGTIAAFVTIVPNRLFKVETNGCATPVGQIVKKPNGPAVGTTVILNEYACASDGTGQRELVDWMANVRVAPPMRLGGPNPAGYVASRVSAIRHGVIATNAREPADDAAATVASLLRARNASTFPVATSVSVRVGCQYSGAGQDFSGTAPRCG